jgi:benzylsuccinate CoA-transferase BbsF subunit
MSGYGSTGPYRDYLCYGSATEAMTGMTALLGYPGEEPLNSAIAYPDVVAGLSGAASVLTALVERTRTGRGQFLDLSQVEPATAMWGEYFLEYQLTGRLPARTGNQHPYWAPHGTYRCATAAGDRGSATSPVSDNWISIAVRSDDEWQRLRELAGLPEEPRHATAAGRLADRARLDDWISTWTADKDKFVLMERLQRAGIPAGAVLNARELVEDPHLAVRGFFVNAAAPEGGDFPMPGTPITVDGRRRERWYAAPFTGEHNRSVLAELLQMDGAAVDRLTEMGVLAGGAKLPAG